MIPLYCTLFPVVLAACAFNPQEHLANWEKDLREECRASDWIIMHQGILNVLADGFIFVLPLPIICNLHLPPKKKTGLVVVFMTGFL